MLMGQFINENTWRYFWHPVCTMRELRDANADGRGNRKKVRLLGETLVIAETDAGVIALDDRCPAPLGIPFSWLGGRRVHPLPLSWLEIRRRGQMR